MKSYKIYKNCISEKTNKKFFNFMLNLITSFEKDFIKHKKYTGWNDIAFNKSLIKLRKKKEVFSAIYNTALKSNALQKIPFENNLHKIAGKFLNIDDSKLTIRGITFRMDPPNDKRNSYGWHQDSIYDKFNVDSKNGVIFWIPLIDANKKNGTLDIKIGSENSSYHCSNLIKKSTKYHSKQILVDKKHLKKYKTKSIPVKKNNGLVTFNGLFHRSGVNLSNKFRFTFVIRYGNMFSDDFVFRRNLRKKN